MSWFNKVFKKEAKKPFVESVEDRIKALNEKTLQKEKEAEITKLLAGRIEALSRKDINVKRDEYNEYRRSRLNASRDNDSDDIKLPSIGGMEDDYDRQKYGSDGYGNEYPQKSDRFSPMNGYGDNGNRRNNDQSGYGSSGGQQSGSSSGASRCYNSLYFIDLPLPRK